MAADLKQDFNNTGPKHLVGASIDWNNEHHRRIIMASLVNGVYTLKSDQKKNRQGRNALAPPWWEHFHFEKTKELHDPKSNNSIFGAIFKFKFPNHISLSGTKPPKYVIAFRGTSLESDSFVQDLKLDLECIVNWLYEPYRVQIAMEAVKDTLGQTDHGGVDSIWLAGHSLGAAIALTVGRDLALLDSPIQLQTYLFNPPCAHLPAATSPKCHKIKGFARGCRSIVIAAAVTIKGCHEDDSEFNQLSTWTPNIFVNPMDRICKEYIGYFEHREKMDKYGLGRIERVATQHSVACLIPGAKPSHLLPVARLTINKGQLKQAHALQQSWVPQQQIYCESKIYNKFWQEKS